MDILIKNMKMPKKGNMLMVAIFSDGSVDWKRKDEMKTHRTKAIELPEHGRCVDADKLRSETNYLICTDCEIESCEDCDVEWCKNIIENAPTVLEAST